MKINLTSHRRPRGFILLLVLVLTAISLLILAGDIYRTSTVAKLNMRSNQLSVLNNAAEAATEKVYSLIARDFAAYGPGLVSNSLSMYMTNYPNANDNAYWTNFVFSDTKGNTSKTLVLFLTNYTGPMPTQYTNDIATTSPIYRIASNVTMPNSSVNVVGTAQEDVMLALVPITTYAIFYNGQLEFSDCATMTVSGRVHCNTNICDGTPSSLLFNGAVTCCNTITSPTRGGVSYSPADENSTYSGGKATNQVSVQIAIPMTNTHSILDIPPSGELPTSITGMEREYNIAQVVLIITNTPTSTNVMVTLQQSYNGAVPGNDPAKTILTVSNATTVNLTNNTVIQLPFLSITNTFGDQREGQTNLYVTQIDVGSYRSWALTNTLLLSKLPPANNYYPTVLYVADRRNVGSSRLSVVRLVNGQQLPSNGGLGFTVATPNPLYIKGNYNTTTDGTHFDLTYGSTTNGYTVSAALLSDAITVLSSNWVDGLSLNNLPYSGRANPANTTMNAAIITGNVPSTGTTATTFSGGVHNLTRLLENWGSSTLTYNTSIVCLFASQMATNQFQMPGVYYNAPTRNWGFDTTFYNPNKQPPGVPCAIIPIRFNWLVPPPSTVGL